MERRRSLPTIDVSPGDSDVEIVSNAKPAVVAHSRDQAKGDGPSMAAFPLIRPTGERKFWSGAEGIPVDFEDDQEVPETPPRARRTVRSIVSKLLFLAIVSVVLTLVACEVSIVLKVPWLDPRPALSSVRRLAAAKISHLRGR